jgi:N-ethylmaleimide reductase
MARPDLFTPFQLGPLLLPSRIVMAPMTRNRAGDGNVPTPLDVEYYRQRTSAGLIITEATQVSPQGVGYPATPGIHSDAQVAGWRRVTDAVHQAGGRIFLQLWHVGRISHPSMQPGGALPVAPSAIAAEGEVFTASGPQPFVVPRALETDEIEGVVAQFEAGARRALAAGFDGVEIHGANGYLIDQFLRDGTNRRTDRYGGSVENRARFLLEVTEAVIGVWGAARVGVRLSPLGTFNSMSDSDPARTFGFAAEALGRYGLAYLHVVEGGDESGDGPFDWAELRRRFRGPYMANGNYNRERASAALAAGRADLVSFATAYIANPDLVERFRLDARLADPAPSKFYGGDHRGYTDYPALDRALAA